MRGKNQKKAIGSRIVALLMVVIIMTTSVQLNAFAQEVNTQLPEVVISEEDAEALADDSVAWSAEEGNIQLPEVVTSEEEVEALATDSVAENVAEGNIEEMSQEEYAKWKEAYLLAKEEEELSLMSSDTTRSVVGNYIRNDVIEAYVDSEGEFTIGTVNGSKLATDNNKILLYGHPNPRTSYTTIRVDGSDYRFYGTTNRVETEDAIMVSHMIDNVVTTQSLSIVENEYTGEADTVAITYTMTNYDDENHEVGLRIMLDTMLGNNDGSPFKVPGTGNVTKELEFTGNAIPQNWMTFDSLDNPQVIANGCFYRSLDEKPDKVQFAYWPTIVDSYWNYTVTPNKTVTGDSAVAAYYNPKTLAPGESRTVTTYYGIGDFAVSDAKPPLSTRVAAPAELKADMEEGGYSHNPFSVIAYIQNNGNGDATNVKAQLKLPADGSLQLVSPAELEQALGNVGVGEEVAVTWLVQASSQTTKKTANYSITVSADNEAAKSVNIATILPATKIENNNFTVKLNKKKLELAVDGTYYTQLKAECSDGKKRNVTWLSTNASVAKVDSNGMVKAISGGSAKIIASVGSKNAICEVEVEGTSNPLQKLELSENTVSLRIGQTKQLVERYTPTTVSQKGVKWTSSNPAVVKVNANGRLEAIANGTAQVKAVYNADNSKYAVCNVQVGSTAQNIQLNQNIGFKDTLYGPKISILNKTFNMFKIPMSTEIKLNEAISLQYDEKDKTLTGTFGLAGDDTLTDVDGYKNDYTKIKKAGELLKKKGPEKFVKSYGKMLKNKKNAPVFFQKGKVSSFGYVKYQQVNDTYKFAEGEVYLVMQWDEIFSIKYNIPACPVVYFKFNISGDVHGGLKLEAEELGFGDGQTIKPNGNIGGKLALSGGVGADILIAGLEGGLTGTLSIDMNHLLNFNVQQDLVVKISASLYAKAKALFFLEFNHNWEFASKQLYPKVANDATMVNLISLDNDNFVPMQVNVDSMDMVSACESVYDMQQLENKGYAYNEPQMVRLSDGRIFAVWCDNIEGRSEFDRTGIYYAVYEYGRWTEPRLVDDDGTADFSPVLAANNDEVYIAWQNMDKEFGSSAAMDTMMPFTGIKMASYKDGDIRDVKVLSGEGDHYDAAPRIAVTQNEVSVVWCNNDSDDWTLYEGNNTLKQYRKNLEETSNSNGQTENVAAEVSSIYSKEAIITSYDAAYKNEQLITVFNAEEDFGQLDEEGVEQLSAAHVYIDGVEDVQLASEIVGRQIKLVQNDDHTDLFWWDGTCIKTMRDLDREQVETCYKTPAAVNFKVTSWDKNSVLYWSEINGDNSLLKAVIRDEKTEKWSSPVDIYEFDGVIRDPAVSVDANGNLEVLTNLVYLDENNNDESVALAYLEVPYETDIQIVGEPYFNDFDVTSEADLDVHVDVKNNGTASVEAFVMKLMDSNGKELVQKQITEPLLPGETKTVSAVYTLPESMSYHSVIVQVVPVYEYDCNMLDNEVWTSIGKADVSVSDIKVSGLGDTRRIFVEVSNKGYQQAENIEVFVTAKTSDGSVLGSETIDVLEGRTKKNVSFDVRLSELNFEDTSGILLYAQVAGEGVLGESAAMSSVILNPIDEDTVTIGSGMYDNKKIVINAYNNVDKVVTADLYIELMEQDDTIFRLGQEIALEPYATWTNQFDLKSLLMYPHDRICVYMMDDTGKILSNKIYLNSQTAVVDEFDILLDKEQLILKKGDVASLKSKLSLEDWELADLVWTSTDESIVTVDTEGNVAAIKEGIARIHIGSSILGLHAECKVIVVDETPIDDYIDTILRTKDVTVDMAKDSGAVIRFSSIYEQNASDVMLDTMEVSEGDNFESSVIEGLVLENEEVRELFEVSLLDDATAVIMPSAKAVGAEQYINKTYKTEVSIKHKGSNEKVEIGELTIKTVSSLPQVKATVDKMDCYYKDTVANVEVKSKGKVLEDVVAIFVDSVVDSKKNKNPEYFVYDNEEKVLKIADDYKGIMKKGKYPICLLVNLKGYAASARAYVTVEVKETTPVIKLTSSEIRLRAVPAEITDSAGNVETRGRYAYLPLTVPKELQDKEIAQVALRGDNSNIFDIRISEDKKNILLKNQSTISGKQKYEIAVRYEDAAKDICIPVTVQAISDAGDYRVSEKSVTINRVSVDQPYAQVKISGAADNDSVSITNYAEVIKGKETYLNNLSVSYEEETGLLTIYPGYKTGTFKLKIYPEGSDKALNLSVKVVNKYPVYKVNKSSISLNTQTRESQTIYISNNAGASNGFSYSIKNSKNRSASVGSITYGEGYISITPYSYVKAGNYKLLITPYNSGGKTLKVNIKVSDKAPKFSVSPGSVKLSNKVSYQAEQAVFTIKSNPAGHTTENFYFYQLDKRGRKYSVTDFNIIKGADGKIYVSRKSDNVLPGTYKLQAESQNYSKAKPFTFKVVVEDKAITMKQKGTILLNSNIIAQQEKCKIELSTTANINNYGEFAFYEKVGNKLSELQNVIITRESDGYYVALADQASIKKGTINLVAKSLTYTGVKDVNIKVSVTDAKPIMKASFDGKIDSVDPTSYIEIAFDMKNSSVKMSNEGKISINNANFNLYSFRPENNTVRIRLASGADLSASNAKTAVITYEDIYGNKVETAKITVPLKTTKVKVKTDKSLYEIYRADKADEAMVKLMLDGSSRAVVERLEFVKAEDASMFELRCVSQATRKYAIGIVNEQTVAEGTYKVKLKVKVRGVAKPVEVLVGIDVK